MTPEVETALIVAISATSGPLLLVWAQSRVRSKERIEDQKREDEVAARAAAAAQSVKEKQDAVIAQGKDVNDKLNTIHTLVNSDMTVARQSELNQTRLVLSTLQRLVAADEKAGRPATSDDLEAVETAKIRIDELQGILADRLRRQRIVEADDAAWRTQE